MAKILKNKIIILFTLLLSGCIVGPNYLRPKAVVPLQYKEAAKNWKLAEPKDNILRGRWWEIFNDPELDDLEEQLIVCNQTVAAAVANYRNALALVDETRAAFFPTVIGFVSVQRQKTPSSPGTGLAATGGTIPVGTGSSGTTGGTSSTGTGSGVATTGGAIPVGTVSGSGGTSSTFTSSSVLLNASWEPDLWGSVHRMVEASVAGAQASAALLASMQLSAEGSLAQFYFELRGLDVDQQLLDKTVIDYRKTLQLTKNQFAVGVAGEADVVQAQTQLENAESQAINNHINRAIYEHAIAVLVGKPPALFGISYHPHIVTPPPIPIELPSALLERRPDVAQAERLMAQANAQVGVAMAACFPSVTLSASGIMTGWLESPSFGWALGAQLEQIIFDGGLRLATIRAARASYDASVANYRQALLVAFQDVEDNMASLRILTQQAVVQNQAAASARKALKIVINQYKAGTVAYVNVIVAQITAFTAEKNAADIYYLRMTAAVRLIKALGGGWDNVLIGAIHTPHDHLIQIHQVLVPK